MEFRQAHETGLRFVVSGLAHLAVGLAVASFLARTGLERHRRHEGQSFWLRAVFVGYFIYEVWGIVIAIATPWIEDLEIFLVLIAWSFVSAIVVLMFASTMELAMQHRPGPRVRQRPWFIALAVATVPADIAIGLVPGGALFSLGVAIHVAFLVVATITFLSIWRPAEPLR